MLPENVDFKLVFSIVIPSALILIFLWDKIQTKLIDEEIASNGVLGICDPYTLMRFKDCEFRPYESYSGPSYYDLAFSTGIKVISTPTHRRCKKNLRKLQKRKR
jgi:hypothetical protein